MLYVQVINKGYIEETDVRNLVVYVTWLGAIASVGCLVRRGCS